MQERRIHQIFVVSVAAKGLHALLEVAGGLTLYLLSSEAMLPLSICPGLLPTRFIITI